MQEVLANELYKTSSESLPENERKRIEEYLEKFIENFSMGLIGTFGTIAAMDPAKAELQKAMQNMSGTLITKENGD